MGTRGAWGFRINGIDKVTYNHHDSYPSGLGKDVLAFVKETSTDELKTIAEKIRLVKESGKPTEADIKKYKALANLGVSEQSYDDWCCLLRNSQGEPELYRDDDLDIMIDSHKFLLDSLFCEYAYIINIDDQTFEFYTGYNKTKGTGRYDSKQPPKEPHQNDDYWGVRLVKSMLLEKVQAGKFEFPKEFV